VLLDPFSLVLVPITSENDKRFASGRFVYMQGEHAGVSVSGGQQETIGLLVIKDWQQQQR